MSSHRRPPRFRRSSTRSFSGGRRHWLLKARVSPTASSMKKGVVAVSNNCNVTIQKDQKVDDGGIGYDIRRIVEERANSAREGVDIVIDLMKKYGYFHMGRICTIADRTEAWQISLLRGHRYLARKVEDNQIAFIANAFAFDKVDLKDPNVIASPDLIEHTIEMGAYKPAKAGTTPTSRSARLISLKPDASSRATRNASLRFWKWCPARNTRTRTIIRPTCPHRRNSRLKTIRRSCATTRSLKSVKAAGITRPCRISATSVRSTPWCSSLQRFRSSPWLGVLPDVPPNSSTRRHSLLLVPSWLRRI